MIGFTGGLNLKGEWEDSDGVAITNIGPKIWFMDQSQSDPAPTNMRIGFLAKIYDDDFNVVETIDISDVVIPDGSKWVQISPENLASGGVYHILIK